MFRNTYKLTVAPNTGGGADFKKPDHTSCCSTSRWDRNQFLKQINPKQEKLLNYPFLVTYVSYFEILFQDTQSTPRLPLLYAAAKR